MVTYSFNYVVFVFGTLFYLSCHLFCLSLLVLQNSLGDALMLAGARLTVLDLSDNAFGPDGVKGIEKLLKSTACYTLQELRLNNCGMGIGGGKVSHENVFLR